MISRRFFSVVVIIILLATAAVMAGCGSQAATSATSKTTTQGQTPGSGAVVNSDSIVTASINAYHSETTGYSWSAVIVILAAQDVGDLPNPVKGKVGSVITVETNDDMSGYMVGDKIQAHIKYGGDAPNPGIVLVMSDVVKQ